MTPLATYLLNQEFLRLLNHQATLRNSAPGHEKGTSLSTTHEPQHCNSRSGVYFNDREVPQDMHVPFISRSVYAAPKLPSGKPMPQPPRLVMTTVTRQIPQVRESEVEVSTNKRQQEGEGNHDRESKRLRTGSNSLTTEQEAFIEAALALTSVRNAGQQPSLKSSPFHSSTSALRGALPPPPFSLSTRLDFSKPHSERVAKSA
eukprot:CAMPEP_0170343384 /NCGR_PEP_ID=MMETSP0116_2-20130129/72865_1 /TAXON_ID=400756 /ORGANISM="Durinskia baltica, Strain CSIRO CS-38" /LENGTH=202 /DNA_ID=CAMNT_0010597033 /DNA_START=1 /DNA_END=609 /DNA_ORIENTATION=+